MNWMILKEEILEDIKTAGITNKEAIRTILKFERRLNTTKNLLYKGTDWETLCYSNPYNEAGTILEDELSNRCYREAGRFHNEWKAYCEVAGYSLSADLGDFLA